MPTLDFLDTRLAEVADKSKEDTTVTAQSSPDDEEALWDAFIAQNAEALGALSVKAGEDEDAGRTTSLDEIESLTRGM